LLEKPEYRNFIVGAKSLADFTPIAGDAAMFELQLNFGLSIPILLNFSLPAGYAT